MGMPEWRFRNACRLLAGGIRVNDTTEHTRQIESIEDEKAVFKQAVKEAITEWLDIQFVKFGKWTFRGILSSVLGYFGWFYFHHMFKVH